ncbi:MAG: DUF4367 domain-containing protein [Oscillospiraceae bacterium]|nr:DUF4367 domain-containing protein [Oscillospiraceae bacterium]
MNKKKAITIICICIAVVLVAGAVIQGIRLYNREKDPYWQAAKKLYNVESALKEVDEDWELESLSTVTPYTYANSEGVTITYYHCRTAYLTDDEVKLEGMNTEAIEQVVDIEILENSRECEVNGQAAIIGELDGRTYLCWTLDPENSCVIEYAADTFAEEDIFRMAESVQLPEE